MNRRWRFFQPISINVWRMGTISLAVMYSAPSYASAAEEVNEGVDRRSE